MRITPNSMFIGSLLGNASERYVIPPYQRRYSWHEQQVWDLIDDISQIENNETHLLGSIVCLIGAHDANLNSLELVDGQQRITTIMLILECLRKHYEEKGDRGELNEILRLITARPRNGAPVRKVFLESIDAAEFERLANGETCEPAQNPALVTAFGIVREWLSGQSDEKISKFLYQLQNLALVIRLDVGDAKDAFKLFETINNRGLRLSPTDIIKNFLLGNAARFGSDSLEIAKKTWAALLVSLDGIDADTFFRYYLSSQYQVRITRSHVVSNFKRLFMNMVAEAALLPDRHLYSEEDDNDDEAGGASSATEGEIPDGLKTIQFKDFLNGLLRYAKVYGELVKAKTGVPVVDRHLRSLIMIKATQTYGFLTRLRAEGCDNKAFVKILEMTESLILRRHICKERANETETLFAALCKVDPKNPITETRNQYRDYCPSDDKFREEFSNFEFSANVIDRARYCLEQFELSRHGEYSELQVLGSESVHVEHIIPQKIVTKKAKEEFGDWVDYLGENSVDLHPDYVSRIGNLTIFSGTLNISASNNPFSRKKAAYKKSGISITKELAELPRFNFRNVEKRSQVLADLAVRLWPQP